MDLLILNHYYYYYYYYYYIAGLRFLTALVFYSQSDYLNHSHRDIDWLIVTCFMKVKSILTILFFAFEIKFVLKI